MTAEPLRDAVLAAASRTVALGLNHGTSGNVSARTADGFLITPSGRPFDTLMPADLVEVGAAGSPPAAGLAPSTEWPMHRAIYAARPEVAAVVHAHSAAASAVACINRGLPAFHYMIAVAGGDSVRIAGYAPFGTRELGDLAVSALHGRLACLLAHHGLVAIGSTLDQALDVAVEVEFLADLYLRLLPLGEPPILAPAVVDDVLQRFRAYRMESR